MKLKFSEANILKLVSVLFAVVLWLYVLGTESQKIEKVMEVEYILPKGLAISSTIPKELSFTLQGPRAFVRTILDNDEKLYIDLARFHARTRKLNFTLRPRDEDLPIPFGVSVLSVNPEVLTIKLEKELRKVVKINPHLVGRLDPNYRLVEQKITPDSVEIAGPHSIVEQINDLKTPPIDISKLETSGVKEVGILPLDPRIQISGDAPVDFHYVVRPIKANLALNNIKIRFLTSKKIVKTSHKTCTLLVLSKEGEKTKVYQSEVDVIADIPEGQVGKFAVNLKANLPENLHLLEIRPSKIFVTVK